jgi:hypothetical protein
MREAAKRERLGFEFVADIHEIEGGGYWADVPRFPGCVAQAESSRPRHGLTRLRPAWPHGDPQCQGGETPLSVRATGRSRRRLLVQPDSANHVLSATAFR